MAKSIEERPWTLKFIDSTPDLVKWDARRRYGQYLEDVEGDSMRQSPGATLKELREALGWSQSYLAEELGGVNAKRISDWENGRRAISKDFAKKLSMVLNIPAERFI